MALTRTTRGRYGADPMVFSRHRSKHLVYEVQLYLHLGRFGGGLAAALMQSLPLH